MEGHETQKFLEKEKFGRYEENDQKEKLNLGTAK